MDRIISKITKQPGFIPLFIAQFGGALNDNLFRSAILILIAFHFTAQGTSQNQAFTALLSNLALIVFLLPLVLLSPLAGQMADRLEKSAMMQKNKVLEMIICIFAAAAFYSNSIFLMFASLFLLGAQSAMFIPNKYAFLPQILSGNLVLKANSIFAAGTFVAVTLGALLGSLLVGLGSYQLAIGPLMLLIAFIGYRATCRLPEVERGSPSLEIDFNLFRQARKGIEIAREKQPIWISIIGISWFWALGSVYLTQLPAYTKYLLRGDALTVSLLVANFILGIGIGAFLCTRTYKGRNEPGLIPIGLIGLILACLALSRISIPSEEILSAAQLLSQSSGQWAVACTFFMGFFGGLYLVPQYTLIQQHTALGSRARVIAANNLLNGLFMLAATSLSLFVLGIAKWSLQSYLLAVALASLPALVIQTSAFSQEFWRLVGYVLARSSYRIELTGRENIPDNGPALLVCNHISYADSVILFGSIPRPTRFIMEDFYYRIPVLNWAFRGARTIPICSPLKNRKIFEAAEKSAVKALADNEMVFIFPEGRLSPEGEMIPFKRGVMRILERQTSPVVPVAIFGLWGSYFSHGGAPALKGLPKWRLGRRRVLVHFGKPMPADETTLEKMQQRVSELHTELSTKYRC